jgi:hypothetical protein
LDHTPVGVSQDVERVEAFGSGVDKFVRNDRDSKSPLVDVH